jgi:hypothetical protein
MKTIEQNTDEFIKYVGIVKQWFQDEELEVSDYVIGRMASRIQTLFKDATKAQLIELVGPDEEVVWDKMAQHGITRIQTRNAFRAELRKKISGDRKG